MWSCDRSEPQRRRTGLNGGAHEPETLYDRVTRQKHRWLKRAMFDCAVSSSEKCFAYLVIDRLNCVTLDCWPSQKLIADQFGWSTKTVHRVSFALKRRGYLRISRNTHGSYRYAPIFLPEDEDKSGGASRQDCPPASDRNVHESSLSILINQSSPSAGEPRLGRPPLTMTSNYDKNQRGLYERELARRLGNNGFEVLERLADHDDAIVERLCRAFADGKLGERELSAARLAADQLPKRWRPS